MGPRNISDGLHRRKYAKSRSLSLLRNNSGFGLVDIIIGLMCTCILAGIAVLNVNAILPGMRTNTAMNQVVAQLRRGRESAITQRRNIEMRFLENNRIQLLRIDSDETETVLNTLTLGNQCEFMKFDSVEPDTPDEFGNQSAVDFQGTGTLFFSTEGTLIDGSGTPVNGTVFLGLAEHPEVARAVTVLGATGRVRSYRWTGQEWIQ